MKNVTILLSLVILLAAGCASEDVKPSDDALSAAAAYDRIQAVKEAYEMKNQYRMEELAPDLAGNIANNFFFDKSELSFERRLVRITGSSIIVNINWQGHWWFDGDREIKNRGVADFVLNRERMILSRIDGDSPFKTPQNQ